MFEAISTSMICAAQYDHVAAVVLHSDPGEVWMTIVDGKQVHWISGKKYAGNIETVTWNDVATELLKGQKEIQSKRDKIDMVTGGSEGEYDEASITDDLY